AYLARRISPFHALFDKPFRLGTGAIVASNVVSFIQQTVDHLAAHRAESDVTNSCHECLLLEHRTSVVRCLRYRTVGRTLITNATIITVDSRLGDIPVGDILIDDDRIAAVEPTGKIPVRIDGAEIVDGRQAIVIPGLINAHMHTWQTALRGIASNWTLTEYFRKMHAGLATVFQPDDLYIANLIGALNQLNCGTTTL